MDWIQDPKTIAVGGLISACLVGEAYLSKNLTVTNGEVMALRSAVKALVIKVSGINDGANDAIDAVHSNLSMVEDAMRRMQRDSDASMATIAELVRAVQELQALAIADNKEIKCTGLAVPAINHNPQMRRQQQPNPPRHQHQVPPMSSYTQQSNVSRREKVQPRSVYQDDDDELNQMVGAVRERARG